MEADLRSHIVRSMARRAAEILAGEAYCLSASEHESVFDQSKLARVEAELLEQQEELEEMERALFVLCGPDLAHDILAEAIELGGGHP